MFGRDVGGQDELISNIIDYYEKTSLQFHSSKLLFPWRGKENNNDYEYGFESIYSLDK